jgi:hypothetical protein
MVKKKTLLALPGLAACAQHVCPAAAHGNRMTARKRLLFPPSPPPPPLVLQLLLLLLLLLLQNTTTAARGLTLVLDSQGAGGQQRGPESLAGATSTPAPAAVVAGLALGICSSCCCCD